MSCNDLGNHDKSSAAAQCGCGASCGGMRRRDFLQVAGLGFVATTLGMPLSVMAGPFEKANAPLLIPADKKLARGWVHGQFERGVKEAFRGNELNTVGMPVGGIGTGQLYLCGDGQLGIWEIFNRHEFRGTGDRSYNPRVPDQAVDQGFAVVVDRGGKRAAWPLRREGFEEVTFFGEHPIARIWYRDKDAPVTVQMEVFSPFIPLNAKDSALPATIFNIEVHNVSEDTLRIAMLPWLENAICRYTSTALPGLRRTRIVRENGRTLIVHTAEEPPKPAQTEPERPPIVLQDFEGENYGDWTVTGEAFRTSPARGAFSAQQSVTGFDGKGLANSFVNNDDLQGTLTSPPFAINRKHINFLIGGGNFTGETCINLRVDGVVVRTAIGRNEERLIWNTWKMEGLEGKEGCIEIVDARKDGWGHINIDQIELSDVAREGPSGPVDKQEDFGTMALAFAGDPGDPSVAKAVFETLDAPENKTYQAGDEPFPFPERRNGAFITSDQEVAPGNSRTFTFVLAWHAPNCANGHEYANRFADAPAVAHYVLDNHTRLTTDTASWRDTYYDSSLPYWLLDRLHSTVSYLATGTCQWWKNGRFYAYEGVVCCHGTCTHVWNYAHAHARLFPELARSIREMQDFADWRADGSGGGFHPDTGLVGFRSDTNYAADGQCGTILKAYREHLMSADDGFLKRNWPRIKQALEFSMSKDGNDDGLIESTQHNTYDINFEGPNTFVGSLYLAALRAGEEMARDMGDTAFAERARKVFESGVRLTMEKLWNDEYFIQVVDLAKFPKDQYGEGCLSDQLFGQGWARQLALGTVYPEPNVKQALQSIWKYNWAPDVTAYNEAHKPLRWFVAPGEAGLMTCTWPKSAYLDKGVIYKDEVWTGIEYQVAGNMIWEGMVEEGLALCRAVHDRYHPLKRNPYNEVECGDHYARALASWGVYLALAGYEYHGPKGHLGFAPRITPENFKAAFTAAEGWGSYSQQHDRNGFQALIHVRWGQLRLKTLSLALPAGVAGKAVKLTMGRTEIEAAHEIKESRLLITFASDLMLKQDQTLHVHVS